ncbi:hypothetical protein [Shinella sp.]|uniref:phage major tropism determinant n=1 Tax=Shinella sp. TaxID=1870904 RepID=UPI0039E232E7
MTSTTGISIKRPDLASAILVATKGDAIAIRAGTTIKVGEQSHVFETETPVGISQQIVGADYAVLIDMGGKPYATPVAANPLTSPFVAGFHFSPGGCAAERNGGDATPAINPYSLWDLDFRPSCPDPRGMALVEAKDGHLFWVDIYLTGVDHKDQGTSRYGVEIADGWSLPRLDYQTASDFVSIHGKRLLTYDEFRSAAFGVTEHSCADDDPKKTGLDAARTSRFGLMQATGNLWIWGTDGDDEDPRPSIFGGSWISGSFAGSRCAGLDYWAENSFGSIGLRAASDHMAPV